MSSKDCKRKKEYFIKCIKENSIEEINVFIKENHDTKCEDLQQSINDYQNKENKENKAKIVTESKNITSSSDTTPKDVDIAKGYIDQITENIYIKKDLKKNLIDIFKLEVKIKKKIFEAIFDFEEEKQKEIFEAIFDFEEEKQKEIFEAIFDFEEKKQNKIFKAISDLGVENFKKLYIKFISKTYQIYINKIKIDEDFLKQHFTKFVKAIQDNKIEDEESIKQELRESIYRLFIKIKNEDSNLFDELEIINLKLLFNDLHRKYKITDNRLFKTRERHTKKRIKIFKQSMLSKQQYQKLLLNISKNRIYVHDYIMLDLVLYIYESLKDKITLYDNISRYSYDFYIKNRNHYNYMIMTDELFTLNGFSFNNVENKNTINFSELMSATYISREEEHNKLLERYQYHENKIYLYYALSKNISIGENIAKKILNGLNSLNYTYPFSNDLNLTISVIEHNIYKRYPDVKLNDKNLQTIKIDNRIPDIYDEDSYRLLKQEELAKAIRYAKSESLFQYLKSINNFLNSITKIKEKNIIQYVLYLTDIIDDDYRLNYYYEFYFPNMIKRLKQNSFLRSDDYELKLFVEYVNITTNIIKLIGQVYDNSSEIQKNIFKQKYKKYFDLYLKDFSHNLYFELKEKVFIYGIDLELEKCFIETGEKFIKDNKEYDNLCEKDKKQNKNLDENLKNILEELK